MDFLFIEYRQHSSPFWQPACISLRSIPAGPKRAFAGEAKPLHDYGNFLFAKSNTVFPYVMDSPGLKLCDVFLGFNLS